MAKKQAETANRKRPRKPAAQPPLRPVELPPPSPLRGLLPTPPEVVEIVEQWLKDRPASPAARLRITEDLKMQYYFGGHRIACRDTPQGKEVLAADSEIGQLLRDLPYSQHKGIVIEHPEPW